MHEGLKVKVGDKVLCRQNSFPKIHIIQMFRFHGKRTRQIITSMRIMITLPMMFLYRFIFALCVVENLIRPWGIVKGKQYGL